MRVTLQTVADAVGVSRMTVSNAFSRPDQLSPALRERVLAAAERLGYAGPDPLARSLSRGRTGAVGVLFTDSLTYAFTDPVATGMLAGVASVLEPEGIGLTVLSAPRTGGTGAIGSAVIDGVVVYSVDEDSPGLRAVHRRRLPHVLVDQEPDAAVPSIVVEDRAGAASAVRHLLDLGHRRIAIVVEALAAGVALVPVDAAPPLHYVLRERMAGWRGELASAGLVPTALASTPVNDRDAGRAAARLLLGLAPRPTAVVCLSDALALGVLDAASEAAVDVPADLSVVGFDDGPLAAMARPRLTTVAQPVRVKGVTAARLLLDLLDPDIATSAGPHRLPTSLVIRDSTSTAPSH